MTADSLSSPAVTTGGFESVGLEVGPATAGSDKAASGAAGRNAQAPAPDAARCNAAHEWLYLGCNDDPGHRGDHWAVDAHGYQHGWPAGADDDFNIIDTLSTPAPVRDDLGVGWGVRPVRDHGSDSAATGAGVPKGGVPVPVAAGFEERLAAEHEPAAHDFPADQPSDARYPDASATGCANTLVGQPGTLIVPAGRLADPPDTAEPPQVVDQPGPDPWDPPDTRGPGRAAVVEAYERITGVRAGTAGTLSTYHLNVLADAAVAAVITELFGADDEDLGEPPPAVVDGWKDVVAPVVDRLAWGSGPLVEHVPAEAPRCERAS